MALGAYNLVPLNLCLSAVHIESGDIGGHNIGMWKLANGRICPNSANNQVTVTIFGNYVSICNILHKYTKLGSSFPVFSPPLLRSCLVPILPI